VSPYKLTVTESIDRGGKYSSFLRTTRQRWGRSWHCLGEQVDIKKLSDFDDELDFVNYMFELFIASEMCDKEVKELHDIDIARIKRDLKNKNVEFVWL